MHGSVNVPSVAHGTWSTRQTLCDMHFPTMLNSEHQRRIPNHSTVHFQRGNRRRGLTDVVKKTEMSQGGGRCRWSQRAQQPRGWEQSGGQPGPRAQRGCGRDAPTLRYLETTAEELRPGPHLRGHITTTACSCGNLEKASSHGQTLKIKGSEAETAPSPPLRLSFLFLQEEARSPGHAQLQAAPPPVCCGNAWCMVAG